MTAALKQAFDDLARSTTASGDPATVAEMIALLRTLHAVGRRDLPLGRLFEGHVDALQIVSRYGCFEQVDRATDLARRNSMRIGVWNAPLPGEPMTLTDDLRLSGGKSYASGAGVLTHALVTVDTDDGPQLILVDLVRTAPAIDRDWWRVVGMTRSETHRVRWHDAPIEPGDVIGAPGDYVREPWFGGGALRFAAVQAGGVAALCDLVRAHLVARGREADPHQLGRLAALYAAAQAAADAVRGAASAWFETDTHAKLAHVAAARDAVYANGDRAIVLAQEAVGLEGMFLDHPLSAMLTDLMVYLRQPGPDFQRMRTGAGVVAGVLSPTL